MTPPPVVIRGKAVRATSIRRGMLFRGPYLSVSRIGRRPPARDQRLAIDMENPDIGRREIPHTVVPVNNCLMFGQGMGADGANTVLLLQLVDQQEFLPTPMKPPAHRRKVYQESLNNLLWRSRTLRPARAVIRS